MGDCFSEEILLEELPFSTALRKPRSFVKQGTKEELIFVGVRLVCVCVVVLLFKLFEEGPFCFSEMAVLLLYVLTRGALFSLPQKAFSPLPFGSRHSVWSLIHKSFCLRYPPPDD